MDFQIALQRLNNHANFPADNEAQSKQSILFGLWSIKQNRTPCELWHLAKDVIECLEVINITLNGETPSKVSFVEKANRIDRDLVYTISTILRSIGQHYLEWQEKGFLDEHFRQQLAFICWAIGCAWDLVLAGDIDSLKEDIKVEAHVRGFTIEL